MIIWGPKLQLSLIFKYELGFDATCYLINFKHKGGELWYKFF